LGALWNRIGPGPSPQTRHWHGDAGTTIDVHEELGLGTSLVGLVAGSQFAAAILSRVWAGRQSDTRGSQ